MAPNYVEDLCVPVSSVSTRVDLRSAARGDLVVPRTRLRLGNRAFSVAGPATWNSLPSDVRTASTLSTFRNRLKTHFVFIVVFCSLILINVIRVAYAVRRPCCDFADMLRRFINCRNITGPPNGTVLFYAVVCRRL